MGLKKMGRLFITVGLLSVVSFGSQAQTTCTVTGSSPVNWVNPGPNCVEGGNAGSKSVIIIPAGFTVSIGGADTWTGTRIEINGTLNVNADCTFNSNIMVKNGGTLGLNAKFFLGASSGCGYGVGVQTGGTVDVGGTGSDRLNVCGVEIMKGNGSCNSCGGTNSGTCTYNGSPYCEPAGGFDGPTGYGETGYNTVFLPIKLSSFNVELVGEKVEIKWATEKEEDFDHFEIERANDSETAMLGEGGLKFETIASVNGNGSNAGSQYAATDTNPLIGNNYYRLKAVDMDGTSEYFSVKWVEYNRGRNFVVSPNPSLGSLIKYRINFVPAPNDQVVLIDAIGNVLQRQKVTDTENEMNPGRTLPPGAYLLRYVSANYQKATRVLVKD